VAAVAQAAISAPRVRNARRSMGEEACLVMLRPP
jgi:hypothetical protein